MFDGVNSRLSLNGDPNCGAAYTAAEDDFLLGCVDGCSKTNPSLSAKAPSGNPVCSCGV